jgi:hypothetical protein
MAVVRWAVFLYPRRIATCHFFVTNGTAQSGVELTFKKLNVQQ